MSERKIEIRFGQDALDQRERDIAAANAPPNPYFNWPAVGSTTEFYMTDGDWAALTSEWLRLRQEWLDRHKEDE